MRAGQRHSAETKAKIGAANRGRVRSPEARAKTSAANRGRVQSPESRAKIAASMVRHGSARVGAHTPAYRSWKAMNQRCNDPNAHNYRWYGGRGITICERWQGPEGFSNFLADMSERPEGKTLDRRDTNGPYDPGNCRWVTHQEQIDTQRTRSVYPERNTTTGRFMR